VTNENNTIGLFDLDKSTFTQWPTSEFGFVVVSGAHVFFTELDTNKIGMLDPSTNTLTEWTSPTPDSVPFGIALGKEGRIFFAEQIGKFAMLDPFRNTITEWSLPGTPLLLDLQVSGDFAWSPDFASNLLDRLDLVNNVIYQFAPPTPNSGPNILALNPQSGSVLFTETAGNNIGELFPAEEPPVAIIKVTPVVSAASPVVTPVAPTTFALTHTEARVTPTVTEVTGVVTGGFTEWMIPTPVSTPIGIAVEQPSGTIEFTECGSKVGTLVVGSKGVN